MAGLIYAFGIFLYDTCCVSGSSEVYFRMKATSGIRSGGGLTYRRTHLHKLLMLFVSRSPVVGSKCAVAGIGWKSGTVWVTTILYGVCKQIQLKLEIVKGATVFSRFRSRRTWLLQVQPAYEQGLECIVPPLEEAQISHWKRTFDTASKCRRNDKYIKRAAQRV